MRLKVKTIKGNICLLNMDKNSTIVEGMHEGNKTLDFYEGSIPVCTVYGTLDHFIEAFKNDLDIRYPMVTEVKNKQKPS